MASDWKRFLSSNSDLSESEIQFLLIDIFFWTFAEGHWVMGHVRLWGFWGPNCHTKWGFKESYWTIVWQYHHFAATKWKRNRTLNHVTTNGSEMRFLYPPHLGTSVHFPAISKTWSNAQNKRIDLFHLPVVHMRSNLFSFEYWLSTIWISTQYFYVEIPWSGSFSTHFGFMIQFSSHSIPWWYPLTNA